VNTVPIESPTLRTALRCVEKGWFVFPLGEKSKQPDNELAPHGFQSASNDPNVVREWWSKKPNANIGIDLGRSNLTVLDFDNGKPPAELNLPETLQVSTSRGTHVYLAGTSKQGDMYVNDRHVGEIKSAGGYVLAPNSVHPSGPVYNVIKSVPVAPIPEGLITRLRPAERQRVEASRNGPKIPYGQHDTELHRIAGKLRGIGMEEEAIYDALVEICEKRCENYGSDYLDMCRKHAHNAAEKYPVNSGKQLQLNQKPSEPVAAPAVAVPVVPPTFRTTSYPEFPTWVMKGTSIYEEFVQPYCALNSRIPYFMWVPTAVLLMNYLGTKVKVALKGWTPSMYVVLIGEKDRAHKSSSLKDALRYMELTGLLSMYGKDIKNADGKAIVWEAGSPEGLGTQMQKINAKNAVLYYDELSVLTAKSQIEGSGMMGALLKLYESNGFSNSVKSTKESFSISPNSYTASLITATTDQRFHELWSQFAGDDTGLNTRFTFILQPKTLPEEELEEVVNYTAAATVTRKRADAAVMQGTFHFDYGFDGKEMLKECQKICGGRAEIRAEKWSLYFAVDLGKTVIDEDCINRGVAMVMYEHQVKKYLATEEAATKSAGLQQRMVQLLERNNGRMPEYGTRGFRALTGERKYGTDMWRKAFFGLVNDSVLGQANGEIVLLRSWGGDRE
jgi:Bifunctional DNA primase/polymerase, N-terminal